jgi:hypothetical protein
MDTVERRDDIMRSLGIDLLDRVTGTNGDRPCARSDTGFDTRRRVLEDEALFDGDAEVFRGEEEGRGVGLAGGQAGVVGGDGDLGTLDAGAGEGAVAVCAGEAR